MCQSAALMVRLVPSHLQTLTCLCPVPLVAAGLWSNVATSDGIKLGRRGEIRPLPSYFESQKLMMNTYPIASVATLPVTACVNTTESALAIPCAPRNVSGHVYGGDSSSAVPPAVFGSLVFAQASVPYPFTVYSSNVTTARNPFPSASQMPANMTFANFTFILSTVGAPALVFVHWYSTCPL